MSIKEIECVKSDRAGCVGSGSCRTLVRERGSASAARRSVSESDTVGPAPSGTRATGTTSERRGCALDCWRSLRSL